MKYSFNNLFGVASLLLTFLLASNSTQLFAQDKDEAVRVDTNLVLVNVLVRDRNGRAVGGLRSEQFQIFDDGEKRRIESFSAGDAPVSFGIVYDLHPTTDDRTKSVIESLRQFKSQLRPDDDIFLLAFNMRGEQTFDFIPTVEQLETHMTPPAKREPYSLYDAIYLASQRIQESRNRKRVLIIISDTADHRSRHKLSEVRGRLNDLKTEVYAIVFDEVDGYGYSDVTHQGKEKFPFTRHASPLDRAAILDLTLRSGGSTYFGASVNSLRLFSIYEQIAEEMRSHYTFGFYPEVMDDKQHSVRIGLSNVKGKKDVVLTYRASYQNPKRPASK